MRAIKPKTMKREDLASRFVSAAALPWQKTRHPGVETKALLADAETGLLTVLTKMAPGARLPDHEHVLIEQTYVLQGTLHCDEGACQAGDFVWRPAGSRHEAWAGPEGCLAIAMFQMPNRFHEPDGRVLDFLGNDWEKQWGKLFARRAKSKDEG